jgi:hypothetical protein
MSVLVKNKYDVGKEKKRDRHVDKEVMEIMMLEKNADIEMDWMKERKKNDNRK